MGTSPEERNTLTRVFLPNHEQRLTEVARRFREVSLTGLAIVDGPPSRTLPEFRQGAVDIPQGARIPFGIERGVEILAGLNLPNDDTNN